jgi:hypothetical protein
MPPSIYKDLTQIFCLFWVGFIKCNFLPNLQKWHYTINQNVINLIRNFVSFHKRSCFFSFYFPWTFYIFSPTSHVCKSFSAQTIGLPHLCDVSLLHLQTTSLPHAFLTWYKKMWPWIFRLSQCKEILGWVFMLGKAWGIGMHIITISMFYPTCKNFLLIWTRKKVFSKKIINKKFPLKTQFKGFFSNPFKLEICVKE